MSGGRGTIINPGGGGGSSNSACIDVRFAHSGLNYDLKLGAAPLITLNREFLQDSAGTFIGINNKVNLTGQIRPSGTQLGFTELMKREDRLRRLFSYGAGDFEITREGKPIFSGLNAKVVSYSTEKSDNNWVLSMGYSVDLEFYEPVQPADKPNSYRVSSINEAWSLEPIEEHIYTLIATPASNPDPDATGGQTQIENIPQFRLTRKLSAVGVQDVGFYSHFDKARNANSEYNFKNISGGQTAGNDAYLQAKKWVDDRLNLPFDTTENASARYTTMLSNSTSSFGSMFNSFSNLYLYNHTRNINYSITDGSYDVSDSWLALPKATRFTEDFTIETSTDNKNIRSVRVQGTINGLQITNGKLYGSGVDVPDSGKSEIKLGGYDINGEPYSNIVGEKYNNAASGWIYDVKPILYKRACLAINSSDRTQPWYQPNQGTLPPGNPAFRLENALNYIPISTSETHDIFNGTVGYSYEYNNIIKIISGVISESYKINTTGPADHIAEVFVLNRPLGPVLQNLATKTSTTKNIEIELVVVPPTSIAGFSFDDPECPVGYNSYIFSQCEAFIDAQRPLLTDTNGGIVFRKNDTYGWSPTDGRFSRNVEWLYQPCVKDGHPYQFLK
jgi:hypothetical protein